VSASRPTLAELRVVAQPESTVGRVSGEHWAGRLYMRHLSLPITRWLVPTAVTADSVTWSLVVVGLAAAVLVTVPHWWAALVVVGLAQLQGLLDCVDGELARWRRQTGPTGIYVDRIAHYVTDAGMALAVGVRAGGGLGHDDGWTTIGLCTGVLALLVKTETDLVHTARALSGRPPAVDTAATAASHATLIRRLRAAARTLPFNRALLAMELSGLSVAAAVADALVPGSPASKVLSVGLLAIAGVVAVGHLLAIVTSNRLR
jgi:phosphatidylglycerophosphate synthase